MSAHPAMITTREISPSMVASIVIPVFNKSELTVQCLNAIESVTNHIRHEVIVVDNASTDDTPSRLRDFQKRVTFIRNEKNLNFAGACNQGAAKSSGKYVVFLNNDTIPLKGWLDALIEEVERHPKVVLVGSRLLYRGGQVQHAGVAFSREARSPFHPYRYLRADDPRVNRRRELQAVTAACCLIRPEWFRRCGCFDEAFKNGYEDLDLCLKIREQRGVIVYQPKSVLFHIESQTPGRMKHDGRNRTLFFERWADRIMADEDAYYLTDGYKIVYRQSKGMTCNRLAKIATHEERERWRIVAQLQCLAAEGQVDKVAGLLQDCDAWPDDAGVRRWAGILCSRLSLKDEALKHFETSLKLEDMPEVRVQLAELTSAPPQPSSVPMPEWVAPQLNGSKALQSGDAAAACDSFERALMFGASPTEVLSGLALAALRIGDAAKARKCALALLAQESEHPVALQVLEQTQPSAVVAGTGAKDQPTMDAKPHTPRTCDMAADTSIVILSYNQLAYTKACLESIERHTPEPYELILVDNGSTDGTSDYLREYAAQHRRVVLVANRTNRGFAAGNNQGLALATGRQVLFLNNDTVVAPCWLGNMLKVLKEHPQTGVIGPRSNRVLGKQQVEDVSYKSLDELPAFAAAWAEKNAGESQVANRVVGFCLLARRLVVDRIGGLDEQFGSGNFEDDDFCIRAHLAGFETRIADDSFVHHVGNATFTGAGIDYAKAMQTNWTLFKSKWAIPPETPPFPGYLTPDVAPPGVALKVPLPELKLTHQLSADGRCWMDKLMPAAAKAKPIILPPCALVGQLREAQQFFHQKKLPAAWGATRAALKHRPFHPEAYLLLAEIALAAQDSVAALACAQFARHIAPEFRPAKRFLKGKLHGHLKPEWLVMPEEIGKHKSESRNWLSVCLIVKNEERFLGQCLASVKGLAHQVVVVDTGSTDRTVEIAREHGAHVHSFAWCDDFSAARNAALEHATGDWVLMLDADEELPPEQHAALRKLLHTPSVISWRLPLQDVGREAEGCSYVPRLFRNAPGLFYAGRVHEQVFTSIEGRRQEWGLETRLGDATLRHYGYTKELTLERDKVGRNLRLLEQAVLETPGDTNLLMNYGLELTRSGRQEEGLRQYRAAFAVMAELPPALVSPEVREVLLTQFCAQLMAAKRHAEIVQVLASPLAKLGGGLTASLHFTLGLAQMEMKQFAAAAEQFRQCLAKRGRPALTPVNLEIRKAGPRHCLARCLDQMGETDAAAEEFRLAIEADPQSRSVRCDHARFLAAHERQADALNLLFALANEKPTEARVWLQGGQLALTWLDFLEVALDWTAEAERHLPDDPAVVQQRAEALMLAGQCGAALPLWRRWPEASNHALAAALVLCETVAGENQFAPAAADEAGVSREFVKWYQRLLQFNARPTVEALNAKIDVLKRILPSAAGLLANVLVEAAADTADSADISA